MKALAIQQPWAWAVLHAGKNIENRDWTPNYPARKFAEKFRGRFILHASTNSLSNRKWDEQWDGYCDTALKAWRAGTKPGAAHAVIPDADELIFGHLIGSVELADVVKAHPSPWFFGPIGLVLRDPRPFKTPIPFTGQRGFFDVSDEIILHERAAMVAEKVA